MKQLPILLALALPACSSTPELEPRYEPLPEGAQTYDEALLQLNRQIVATAQRAQAFPGSWMAKGDVAAAFVSRAALASSYDDYALAEQWIDSAYAQATPSGPHFTAAAIDFSLHRFDEVEPHLQAVENRIVVDDPTRAAILGLRGDVAVTQADLLAAEDALTQAESLHPTSTSAARLAHLAWRRADYDTAESWYSLSQSRYHGADPRVRAWSHLQLGLLDLDRGRYADALEHYLDANGELSGYALVEEHIAEIYTLTGETELALGLYLNILDRRDNAEYRDAVAGIYIAAGQPDLAQIHIDAASKIYAKQRALYPQAVGGHALGHVLSFGSPEEAVALALQNFAIRPDGPSAELLAQAYVFADRPADAIAILQQSLDAGFDSPVMRDTLAVAHQATGNEAAAATERAAACALNHTLCP